MKTLILGLAFRALARVNRDPEKQRALAQMADEMLALSQIPRKPMHKPVGNR